MNEFLNNDEIIRYAQGFWEGRSRCRELQKNEKSYNRIFDNIGYFTEYAEKHLLSRTYSSETHEERNQAFLNVFALGYMQGRWEVQELENELKEMEDKYFTNLDHFGEIIPHRDLESLFQIQRKDVQEMWETHQKHVVNAPLWKDMSIEERERVGRHYVVCLENTMQKETHVLLTMYAKWAKDAQDINEAKQMEAENE